MLIDHLWVGLQESGAQNPHCSRISLIGIQVLVNDNDHIEAD